MFERGGGDTFEIAVTDDEAIENANADSWELLGDGAFGWAVTHTGLPLVSADLNDEVRDSRAWQFDVDGDANTADQFVLENPDSDVFTTILNVDGITMNIKGTGALANGDAFKIVDADQIVGTPVITSVDPTQNWVFDAETGRICLGSCPGALSGDYNSDGSLNTADLDMQAAVIVAGTNDPAYDLTGDGLVNVDDRVNWVKVQKGTWIGDGNLDGEFDSGDLVVAFQGGKYEQDELATYAQGDWTGDERFGSGDLVLAFQDGGYEAGPAAVSSVPEPSSLLLALLSVLGLVRVARRRNG